MLHRSCPIFFFKLLFKSDAFHLPFIMNSCPDYLKHPSSAVSPEPEGLSQVMSLFLLSQQVGTLSCAKSVKLSLMSERQWVDRGKAISFWSCQPWEEQEWWLVLTAKMNPRQGAKCCRAHTMVFGALSQRPPEISYGLLSCRQRAAVLLLPYIPSGQRSRTGDVLWFFDCIFSVENQPGVNCNSGLENIQHKIR